MLMPARDAMMPPYADADAAMLPHAAAITLRRFTVVERHAFDSVSPCCYDSADTLFAAASCHAIYAAAAC